MDRIVDSDGGTTTRYLSTGHNSWTRPTATSNSHATFPCTLCTVHRIPKNPIIYRSIRKKKKCQIKIRQQNLKSVESKAEYLICLKLLDIKLNFDWATPGFGYFFNPTVQYLSVLPRGSIRTPPSDTVKKRPMKMRAGCNTGKFAWTVVHGGPAT